MAFNHPVTKLKSLYTSVLKVIPLSLAQLTVMNKFVYNTGPAFNLYQYACSLCIDAPIPRKKKRTGRESPSPMFSEGREYLYTAYISTCWWCFWIAFFQQERFKWFLVPLIKNGRTLWKSAAIFLGILIQRFVTNINWNQCKVLLGTVINLLWICFEGSFSIGVQVETRSQSQRYIDLYE